MLLVCSLCGWPCRQSVLLHQTGLALRVLRPLEASWSTAPEQTPSKADICGSVWPSLLEGQVWLTCWYVSPVKSVNCRVHISVKHRNSKGGASDHFSS